MSKSKDGLMMDIIAEAHRCPQMDAIVHRAQLCAAVNGFIDAKIRLEQMVAEMFPIGMAVEVELEKTKAKAIVHAYVAGFPERLALLFENGNVWDKPIIRITPLIFTRKIRCS